MPDFSVEDSYGPLICGLDEVGRGPLAGPVVAACVYIPPEKRNLRFISGLQDSKTLTRPKLEYLEAFIFEHCSWSVATCSPEEIDSLNILQASLCAMERAFEALQVECKAEFSALVDGHIRPKKLPCPSYTLIKGDSLSCSIAAASIIAKLYRDRLMENLAKTHPHYGWETNVGYPTPQHKKAILTHGITLHHRRSFAPVKSYLASKAA